MSFRTTAKTAAQDAGGSFKTRESRGLIVGRLADYLQRQNIQIRDLEHLKARHVEAFVRDRLAAGIGARTLQNEVSGIRTALRAAGRHQLAAQIDNKRLGIAGASRDGTKTAISEERLVELRAAVAARDPAVALVVDLQRALGLRAEEAVKSCKSLDTWARQLAAGQPVRVIFGTKGGRARDVSPADRDRAARAVEAARTAAKASGGVLIAREGEKAAMARYRNVMYAAGFRGAESGHALRYAFARAQIAHYEARGFTRHEALAQTSMDLGHGDGRGRYVEQVYSR